MTRTLNNVETSTRLYYANNVEIGPVKSDLLRDTTTLENVSPWLQKAIVSTEDEDFWTNKGVVPKALVRAVITELTGLGGQTGGSTLTQQVVKLQFLNSQTTFKRKATEIMLALRLNKYYSKQQILEEYLNIITLGRNHNGQNIAGVQTAAQGLFGKNAKDLNLAESAFIAGLPQSPSAYTPYTNTGAFKHDLNPGLNRQKTVLFRMYRAGTITDKQYQEARTFDLKAAFLKPGNASTANQSSGYVYNTVEAEAQTILGRQLAKADGHTTTDLNKNAALKAPTKKRQASSSRLAATGCTQRSTSRCTTPCRAWSSSTEAALGRPTRASSETRPPAATRRCASPCKMGPCCWTTRPVRSSVCRRHCRRSQPYLHQAQPRVLDQTDGGIRPGNRKSPHWFQNHDCRF